MLRRFDNQRSRGTTSFGYYLPETNKLTHNVKEQRIKKLLKRTRGENHEILFHHRYSTSTVDVRNACHPFSTKDHFENNYVGVHNGVLDNEYQLKRQHEELGIKYISTQENGTYNDSEALIYDLARYFEGDVNTLTASGTIAFIVVKRNADGKPVTLFFGTNRGSLVMKRTKNSLTVSSEGDGEKVPDNLLHMFDYETQELRTAYMHIPQRTWKGYSGNSYTPSKTPNYNSGYSEDNWEREYREEYKSWVDSFEDAVGTRSTDFDIDGDTDDVSGALEKFKARKGTVNAVAQDFIEEQGGSVNLAYVAALIEKQEAEQEQLIVNESVEEGQDDQSLQELMDYYTVVHEYTILLADVVERLNEMDNIAQAAAKEGTGKQPFGFHARNSHSLEAGHKQLN